MTPAEEAALAGLRAKTLLLRVHELSGRIAKDGVVFSSLLSTLGEGKHHQDLRGKAAIALNTLEEIAEKSAEALRLVREATHLE